jgi:hypothetical protein
MILSMKKIKIKIKLKAFFLKEKKKGETDKKTPSLPDPQSKKEKGEKNEKEEARNMKRMPKLEPLFSMSVHFTPQSTESDSQCQ